MINRRVITFLAATAALFSLVGLASNTDGIEFGSPGQGSEEPAQSARGDTERSPEPVEGAEAISTERMDGELPDWVLWPIGIAAAIGALWLLSRQRFTLMLARRRTPDAVEASSMSEMEEAEAIADMADGLIDELEFGGEPRVAIQRVYAAVETGFGSRELRRKPAEPPLKYLDRVFGRRQAAAPALAQLTELFQVARFSSEPIDEGMRTEALNALREIRDEYRRGTRPRALSR